MKSGLEPQGGKPSELVQSVIYQSKLYALRGSFERALGIPVTFTYNDAYKSRMANDKTVKYPRAVVKIRSVDVQRDWNTKALALRGLAQTTPKDFDKLQGIDSLKVLNFFPVKTEFELHILCNDSIQHANLCQNLLSLISGRRLTVTTKLDVFEYQVCPEFERLGYDQPDQLLANDSDNALLDTVFPFSARGYIGRIDTVQRIKQVVFAQKGVMLEANVLVENVSMEKNLSGGKYEL